MLLYPLEFAAATEKEYQKNAEALFDEQYRNAAVKIFIKMLKKHRETFVIFDEKLCEIYCNLSWNRV